jgi:hypothetical protein
MPRAPLNIVSKAKPRIKNLVGTDYVIQEDDVVRISKLKFAHECPAPWKAPLYLPPSLDTNANPPLPVEAPGVLKSRGGGCAPPLFLKKKVNDGFWVRSPLPFISFVWVGAFLQLPYLNLVFKVTALLLPVEPRVTSKY